jgi:hypothetical protein
MVLIALECRETFRSVVRQTGEQSGSHDYRKNGTPKPIPFPIRLWWIGKGIIVLLFYNSTNMSLRWSESMVLLFYFEAIPTHTNTTITPPVLVGGRG